MHADLEREWHASHFIADRPPSWEPAAESWQRSGWEEKAGCSAGSCAMCWPHCHYRNYKTAGSLTAATVTAVALTACALTPKQQDQCSTAGSPIEVGSQGGDEQLTHKCGPGKTKNCAPVVPLSMARIAGSMVVGCRQAGRRAGGRWVGRGPKRQAGWLAGWREGLCVPHPPHTGRKQMHSW